MSTKKPAPAPTPPVYNLTCVYTGRRISNDQKEVFQRFVKPDGTESLYKGVKGVWIGHTYKCAEKNISTKPERVDTPRIDNPEWEAADALVDAHNRRKRAEAAIAKSTKPGIKAAIEVLTPLCRGLAIWEREALIRYLARQSWEKEKKARK